MGFKGAIFLLAICLFAVPLRADDDDKLVLPEPASDDLLLPADSPITDRNRLSPLARGLDDLLFGDPQRLYSLDRNPFFYWTPPTADSMQQALSEVQRFRGEQFTRLTEAGDNVLVQTRREVKQAARNAQQSERLVVLPSAAILSSWRLLNGTKASGERRLTQAEINLQANAVVEAAMRGLPPTDPGDNTAATLYTKAFNQIEIFQTIPEKERVSRDEFENWREKEVARLSGIIRDNLLRQLESTYRQGYRPFQVRRFDENGKPLRLNTKDDRPAPDVELTLDEVKNRIQSLPLVSRQYDKNRVLFDYPRGLLMQGRPHEEIISRDNKGKAHWIKFFTTDSKNTGSIALEPAAEGHLNDLLADSIHAAHRAIDRLNQFQYDQYKRDGGAGFIRKWRAEAKADGQELNDTFSAPKIIERQANFPPEFERALWGRFSESPEFWKEQGERPRTWSYVIWTPDALWLRASEPPKPNALISTAKKHPLATVALSAAVTLGSLFGIPAAVGPFHWQGASLNGGGALSEMGEAYNKPMSKDGTILFMTDTSNGDHNVPTRFAFGRPAQATEPISIPQTAPRRDYTVKNRMTQTGPLEIPTADGAQLVSLHVTGMGRTEWIEGDDYEIRRTPTGEYVFFPLSSEGYNLIAGFVGAPATRPALISADLKSLSLERLGEVSKELKANGFAHLPELLDQVIDFSKRNKRPLSVFDLEEVLRQSALYSQEKEKTQYLTLFQSELSRASRFLNPEGVSCYMCDGARELGVILYKKALAGTKIEVIPRNVVVRSPGAEYLLKNALHADILLVDTENGQKVVIDTTPGEHDPRDGLPVPGGQISAGTPYLEAEHSPFLRPLALKELREWKKSAREHAETIPIEELMAWTERNLAPGVKMPPSYELRWWLDHAIEYADRMEALGKVPSVTVSARGEERTPAPGQARSAPVEKHAYPFRALPWRETVHSFFSNLEKADRREPYSEKFRQTAVATGGFDPQTPETDVRPDVGSSVEPTAQVSVRISPPAPMGEPESHLVFDEKLPELRERLKKYHQLLAELKLFSRGERIPSSAATEVLKLVDGYLTRQISEADFKSKMTRYLPSGFEWPLVTATHLGEIVAEAGKKANALLAKHRERFDKGETADYAQLTDPRVQRAINDLFQWTARQNWQPAQLVYTEVAAPRSCNSLMGRLGPAAAKQNVASLKF